MDTAYHWLHALLYGGEQGLQVPDILVHHGLPGDVLLAVHDAGQLAQVCNIAPNLGGRNDIPAFRLLSEV